MDFSRNEGQRRLHAAALLLILCAAALVGRHFDQRR
jgi:hypothetical protein